MIREGDKNTEAGGYLVFRGVQTIFTNFRWDHSWYFSGGYKSFSKFSGGVKAFSFILGRVLKRLKKRPKKVLN